MSSFSDSVRESIIFGNGSTALALLKGQQFAAAIGMDTQARKKRASVYVHPTTGWTPQTLFIYRSSSDTRIQATYTLVFENDQTGKARARAIEVIGFDELNSFKHVFGEAIQAGMILNTHTRREWRDVCVRLMHERLARQREPL